MADFVELLCVKEKNRLRVRIITQGYYNNANCQFPKDLRIEGRKFRIPVRYVDLITQRGKYFYSIKKRDYIEIIQENIDLSDMKIFEDEKNDDCAICLCNKKSMVFYPCGHYYCCEECVKSLKSCPICRASIGKCIEKSLIE